MAFSQIATSVTILNSGLIGYCGVSLTNFATSGLSAIAAGSSVEIAGAFFKADADVTINASSWTAITTATTAYLHLTPSGTAGSQIISAEWSATEPVWNTSKQGWYASAGSLVRVVAGAYKDGPTSQSAKIFLGLNQNQFNSYRMHGFKTVISTVGSSTFTVPNNVYRLSVNIVGGGGGGAGGTTSPSVYGGGGGGGTYITKADATVFSVFPGQVISYTVGTGGAAGGYGVGGSSGSVSIFNGITASGGGGGFSALTGGSAPSVFGGVSGCNGELGSGLPGGRGGGGGCGNGATFISTATPGLFGGGGGGGLAATSGSAYVAGASGGNGIIIVEY